jgi:DNA-binding SARP family transcriptional activator
VLSARERLHAKFLRQLGAVAHAHAEAGNLDAALKLYQRGLECDEQAEALVQGLLRVCLAGGRHAEGLAAYRRHEAALRALH